MFDVDVATWSGPLGAAAPARVGFRNGVPSAKAMMGRMTALNQPVSPVSVAMKPNFQQVRFSYEYVYIMQQNVHTNVHRVVSTYI